MLKDLSLDLALGSDVRVRLEEMSTTTQQVEHSVLTAVQAVMTIASMRDKMYSNGVMLYAFILP